MIKEPFVREERGQHCSENFSDSPEPSANASQLVDMFLKEGKNVCIQILKTTFRCSVLAVVHACVAIRTIYLICM